MFTNFARRIIVQRRRSGYSMTDFAGAIGVSVSYMSLIERGLRPPPVDAKLTAMADVLAMDRDDMFFLAGRLPPDVQILVDKQPSKVTEILRKSLK